VFGGHFWFVLSDNLTENDFANRFGSSDFARRGS
jgi:hypothetical protein